MGVAVVEQMGEYVQIMRRLGKYYRETLGTFGEVKCRVEKPQVGEVAGCVSSIMDHWTSP